MRILFIVMAICGISFLRESRILSTWTSLVKEESKIIATIETESESESEASLGLKIHKTPRNSSRSRNTTIPSFGTEREVSVGLQIQKSLIDSNRTRNTPALSVGTGEESSVGLRNQKTPIDSRSSINSHTINSSNNNTIDNNIGSNKSQETQQQREAMPRTQRLIHDTTLPWNETMHRPWLVGSNHNSSSDHITSNNSITDPPYMILLTTVGWNHPNQTFGLGFPRVLREREFFQALVNHPFFHPTAWEDIAKGILPISNRTNYYVFADVMQCRETNYPIYGGGEKLNVDRFHNRTIKENLYPRFQPQIDRCMRRHSYGILEHPIFHNTKNKNNSSGRATLVLLDCTGVGPLCENREANKEADDLPISLAAIGGTFTDHFDKKIRMNIDRDQGLIPPAPNPVRLTSQEEEAIRTCQADAIPELGQEPQRPLSVTYTGNFRSGQNSAFHAVYSGARGSYRPFHDPAAGRIILNGAAELENHEPYPVAVHSFGSSGSNNTTNNNGVSGGGNSNDDDPRIIVLENLSYSDTLRKTKFALVPRGDNKFSYRFHEALSAGAIPVYHGDNHMLPYRPEVVDWKRCGLVLPEKDAGNVTLNLIDELLYSPSSFEGNINTRLCQMRQYCYFGIYKKYVATEKGQIDGLLAGLEALARGERKPQAGVVCTEDSVKSLDCNPI